jgi:hypothetical protein
VLDGLGAASSFQVSMLDAIPFEVSFRYSLHPVSCHDKDENFMLFPCSFLVSSPSQLSSRFRHSAAEMKSSQGQHGMSRISSLAFIAAVRLPKP